MTLEQIQTAVTSARCIVGALSAAQMDAVLTDLLSQLSLSGGSGSLETSVFTGHYAAGLPTQTPTGDAAIAYDLDEPLNSWRWNPDTLVWY